MVLKGKKGVQISFQKVILFLLVFMVVFFGFGQIEKMFSLAKESTGLDDQICEDKGDVFGAFCLDQEKLQRFSEERSNELHLSKTSEVSFFEEFKSIESFSFEVSSIILDNELPEDEEKKTQFKVVYSDKKFEMQKSSSFVSEDFSTTLDGLQSIIDDLNSQNKEESEKISEVFAYIYNNILEESDSDVYTLENIGYKIIDFKLRDLNYKDVSFRYQITDKGKVYLRTINYDDKGLLVTDSSASFGKRKFESTDSSIQNIDVKCGGISFEKENEKILFKNFDIFCEPIISKGKSLEEISSKTCKTTKISDLDSEFRDKIKEVAENVGTSEENLLTVMHFETGGTFCSCVKNPLSTATGLIQFTAGTADSLGTSIAQLCTMDEVEQMDYVERYLFKYKKDDLSSIENLYLAVFLPILLDLEDDEDPIPERFAKVNLVFDKDPKDGKVTRKEITQTIRDRKELLFS